MAREGYSSTTLDDDLAAELDQLGQEQQAKNGGEWKRPAVIKFLLQFYRKNGTNKDVTKGSA